MFLAQITTATKPRLIDELSRMTLDMKRRYETEVNVNLSCVSYPRPWQPSLLETSLCSSPSSRSLSSAVKESGSSTFCERERTGCWKIGLCHLHQGFSNKPHTVPDINGASSTPLNLQQYRYLTAQCLPSGCQSCVTSPSHSLRVFVTVKVNEVGQQTDQLCVPVNC